jgi:hypothetical protein
MIEQFPRKLTHDLSNPDVPPQLLPSRAGFNEKSLLGWGNFRNSELNEKNVAEIQLKKLPAPTSVSFLFRLCFRDEMEAGRVGNP